VSYQLEGNVSFSPTISFSPTMPVLNTSILGKSTMVVFGFLLRPTLTVMMYVFIKGTALGGIVNSVSVISFFDTEVQEPLRLAASVDAAKIQTNDAKSK
jgi:hypothetical protein